MIRLVFDIFYYNILILLPNTPTVQRKREIFATKSLPCRTFGYDTYDIPVYSSKVTHGHRLQYMILFIITVVIVVFNSKEKKNTGGQFLVHKLSSGNRKIIFDCVCFC